VWHALLCAFGLYMYVRSKRGDEAVKAVVTTKQRKLATASHILVEQQALANELKERLAGGADFASLAREHSQCPSGQKRDGSLGSFPPGQMVPAFDEIVWTAPLGEVQGQRGRTAPTVGPARAPPLWVAPTCAGSAHAQVQGPIKTQFGWHLILVTDRSGPDVEAKQE